MTSKITEQLRHIRRELNLTQAQLGKRVGRNQEAISKLELGSKSIDKLQACVEALGCELVIIKKGSKVVIEYKEVI